MNVLHATFNRKFSMSMYKNMKISLGEMNFLKDFVHDTRGDLYPVVSKSADCTEDIAQNRYCIAGGSVERVIGQFFPFATYEAEADSVRGEMGFVFRLPHAAAFLTVVRDEEKAKIRYICEDHAEECILPTETEEKMTMIVSCRPGSFDVYCRRNSKAEYLTTISEDRFSQSNRCETFREGYVSLLASGSVALAQVSFYLDNGVSIADFRPVKYEDGTVIHEGGKVYFTGTIRLQAGGYQGIFSWVPGTAQFEMTGALYFDCGDGFWRGYLASALVYHREWKKWLIWTSSFEHEHILAYGSFDGEARFGVNVVDVALMEKAGEHGDRTDFLGFKGDEDPDLVYDAEKKRWLLAVCRLDAETRKYVYMFFESDDPFKGFRYIGRGAEGASETGGVFVRANGELSFVCGNDFDKRSEYRIYSRDGMKNASFRYPDGGFRGWGCVMPLKLGSRTRYFWLTFDRHGGSDYRWSYGNVYCFEAVALGE